MATKNKFSNYENLFSAYRESISAANLTNKTNFSQEIENKKQQLQALETELKSINSYLKNPKKSVPNIDTRKSSEFLPKLNKAKKELEDLKTTLKPLSEAARKSAETTLNSYKTKLSDTHKTIETLSTQISDTTTPSNTLPTLKSKRTKAQNSIPNITTNIKKYENIINEDDKKLVKIKVVEEKVTTLQTKYDALLLDEKRYSREANRQNSQLSSNIEEKRARQREIIVQKNKLAKDIAKLEQESKNIPTSTDGDIQSFKDFLNQNGFSTVHAEELYELYKNPNHKLTISKNEFKLRKQHPTRDRILKKFVVPTALTSAGVGIAFGSIAASKVIAGAKWGFITITSNPGLNFLTAASHGAAIGAVAAISTITIKNAITKLHYLTKYGDAEKILNEPESAKLDELLAKIENTKDDILDLRTGRKNIISRFGRAITRTAKNVVNRNRIHHVESITENLVEKFNAISENKEISVDTKLEKLTPIYDLLTKINSFYAKDIKKSKVFAMLNCKETNKNHSHKETIENLDIYAKLSMYLEKVAAQEMVSKSTKTKVHKQVKSDLKKQNIVAERLLNEEQQVTGLVARRYLELVKASNKAKTPASKTVLYHSVTDGDLKVIFADGKTSTYKVKNANKIKNVESVNLGKTLVITYENDEQESISSTVQKPKINLTIAGEYKVYDKLKEVAVIDYLSEQKGIDKDTIFKFIEDLKSTKFNKNGKEKAKPSAFIKSKIYKENAEYEKIIKEVDDIIKNPNIVHIDHGFNN